MSNDLQAKITLAERVIQHSFPNKLLALEALQTSGNPLVWENKWTRIRKNDNLAVLGDVVLKLVLCDAWYETGRPKGN